MRWTPITSSSASFSMGRGLTVMRTAARSADAAGSVACFMRSTSMASQTAFSSVKAL